jgi:hypothetical protein
MTDQIEILKPKPKARQPRQGWTDSKVEIIQENVISPIESSNDGDVIIYVWFFLKCPNLEITSI